MACPQIYLGAGRFAAPLPANYGNPAIGVSGTPLTENVAILIPVTANNHGDNSPPTSLELYWSDPTTGFLAVSSRLIGSINFDTGITGASTLPPAEGEASASFGWTPDATVLGTNGGHVCLLARLNNLAPPALPCTQQTYNSASPATDPLSAIHNVNIIAPPPPSPKPGPPRRRWPMWFAFAATNTLRLEDTKLHVRALDPVKDRAKLEALVTQPAIHQALSKRQLKFGVPNGVQVAEGRERVIAPLSLVHAHREHGKIALHQCLPRISRLGALAPELAPHFVLPGSRLLEAAHGAIALKLLPGEQRQTLVQVEPCDRENVVYAIEVEHEGADGQPIGGLVLLFVPPHDFF